jgi:hypothetical protein
MDTLHHVPFDLQISFLCFLWDYIKVHVHVSLLPTGLGYLKYQNSETTVSEHKILQNVLGLVSS